MRRYLIVEVADDDLSADVATHLVDGLEFAGQRVGVQLRVFDLDPEKAIEALRGVIEQWTFQSGDRTHHEIAEVAFNSAMATALCAQPEATNG